MSQAVPSCCENRHMEQPDGLAVKAVFTENRHLVSAKWASALRMPLLVELGPRRGGPIVQGSSRGRQEGSIPGNTRLGGSGDPITGGPALGPQAASTSDSTAGPPAGAAQPDSREKCLRACS